MGAKEPQPPHSKVRPPEAPKCSVRWLHCAMIVLVTNFCLAVSDANVEFVFVLMASAYRPTVNT